MKQSDHDIHKMYRRKWNGNAKQGPRGHADRFNAKHTRRATKQTQDDHVAAVRLPDRGTAHTPRAADRRLQSVGPRTTDNNNKTPYGTLR